MNEIDDEVDESMAASRRRSRPAASSCPPSTRDEIVVPLSFLAEDDALAASWALRVLAPH